MDLDAAVAAEIDDEVASLQAETNVARKPHSRARKA